MKEQTLTGIMENDRPASVWDFKRRGGPPLYNALFRIGGPPD